MYGCMDGWPTLSLLSGHPRHYRLPILVPHHRLPTVLVAPAVQLRQLLVKSAFADQQFVPLVQQESGTSVLDSIVGCTL